MTRLLVTGASGLFGMNLGIQLYDCYEIVGVVNAHSLYQAPFQTISVDLSTSGVGAHLIEQFEPDAVIHCAAMANVDACESDPQGAQRMNSEMAGELAAACRRVGVRILHLSTDAVFDGQRGGYVETDSPNPINVYARTKLSGEHAVSEANPDALIARVNFYGWSLTRQRSLAEKFYYTLAAGKSMPGFMDVFFCPLQVNDLATTLIEMLEKHLSGLYHVVSPQAISKYAFGVALARCFGLDEKLIHPVSWRDAGLRAVRSPNLTLDNSKVTAALEHSLPDQAAGMERLFESFQSGLPQRLQQLAQKA
jgi:dTDP-4-dehydrorhamnose reductase